jgi:SNF2 family DNA or RNA helicase
MNLFDQFRRKKLTAEKVTTPVTDFFFFLRYDEEKGFSIATTNEKGVPIEPDYRAFSGVKREILRQLSTIAEQDSFMIEWGSQESTVWLAEHSHLLWQLRYCDNVINAQKKKVNFSEEKGHLRLLLTELNENSDTLQATPQLVVAENIYEKIYPITDTFVCSNQTIYEVETTGTYFLKIPSLQATFSQIDLDKYLTLVFSLFENIEVVYDDYKVLHHKEPITPIPCVIFEKIDEHKSLFLRVSQHIEGFEAEFLEQYDISRIASISSIDSTIHVRNLDYKNMADLLDRIVAMVNSLEKGKKKPTYAIDDNLLVLPAELSENFIKTYMHEILTNYAVFGAEKLSAYKIKAVSPKLKINVGSGIDFLEADASIQIEEQKFSIFDIINQYRKKRYIQLNDGTQALLQEKYIQRLERLFKKDKEKVKISFFDLPEIEELIEEKVSGEAFKRSRELFEGFNQLKKKKIKLPKVNAQLRPYQEEGYRWLSYLQENNMGGCLADDMGLGKTLQTITLLSNFYPQTEEPTLIVMPKSLLFNWANELKRFNPQITHYTYYANDRDLDIAYSHNLILTTYATLRNDIEKIKELPFFYCILDESQNIKNLQSQSNKAVMLVQAKHKLALSGTPIENNLTELYALFRFINPAMFGSAEDFNNHYTVPIQLHNDKDAALALRKKIYPFVLRRLKKDVLKDLPDKVEQIMYVDLSPEQAKLYEQRRQHYKVFLDSQIAKQGIEKAQFYVFQALMELRQIASVPETQSDGKITASKRELLLEQIMESVANKHKVLVFVNFLQAIESIGEDLTSAGISYVSMSGATQNRQELVKRFQESTDCNVFILTLKTGGTGLNLTAADTVFIYDPWWNIAAENQAIDRSHRIGQKNTVFSYKLIAKGTIEEKILQLQEQKRELFDNLIGSDSASIKSLSSEDIDFMLGK